MQPHSGEELKDDERAVRLSFLVLGSMISLVLGAAALAVFAYVNLPVPPGSP